MPSSRLVRGALLALCLGHFGCDHAAKIAAECALAGGRALTLAPGVLELRYTRNDDVAFSLLHSLHVARAPWLLLAMPTVALLGVAVAWHAAQGGPLAGVQPADIAVVLGVATVALLGMRAPAGSSAP